MNPTVWTPDTIAALVTAICTGIAGVITAVAVLVKLFKVANQVDANTAKVDQVHAAVTGTGSGQSAPASGGNGVGLGQLPQQANMDPMNPPAL